MSGDGSPEPEKPAQAQIPDGEEKRRGVPLGEFDNLEALIGLRGHGKSTYMCQRAAELALEAGGAYVIGHSIGARLPERLPDGPKLPITYHETVPALARGLRKDPGRWHIYVGETADPLIHYARTLSEGLRRQAWAEKHTFRQWRPTSKMGKEYRISPIIVMIDEGIAVEAAGGNTRGSDDNRWFRSWLFSLRHEHTALLYSIQNANARSWLLLDQATKIHCFKIRHAWALEAMRAAGADDEEVERIRNLPKYEHVTITR